MDIQPKKFMIFVKNVEEVKMSTKVKERLKSMLLEMTHEERVELDNALEQLFLQMGGILIKDEKACDTMIEQIPDDKLREIVKRIKAKKKKKILVGVEA